MRFSLRKCSRYFRLAHGSLVNDGRIEAQGKHKELLDTCGLYREMWQAHIGAKDGDAE